jgi:transposase-like protein
MLIREAYGSKEKAFELGVSGVLLRGAGKDIIDFANEGYNIHLTKDPNLTTADRAYIRRDDGSYLLVTSEHGILLTYRIPYTDILEMFQEGTAGLIRDARKYGNLCDDDVDEILGDVDDCIEQINRVIEENYTDNSDEEDEEDDDANEHISVAPYNGYDAFVKEQKALAAGSTIDECLRNLSSGEESIEQIADESDAQRHADEIKEIVNAKHGIPVRAELDFTREFWEGIVEDYHTHHKTTSEIAYKRGLTIEELSEIVTTHGSSIPLLEKRAGRKPRCGPRRLTDDFVRQIYDRCAADPKISYADVADEYGIAETTVSAIMLCKTRKRALGERKPISKHVCERKGPTKPAGSHNRTGGIPESDIINISKDLAAKPQAPYTEIARIHGVSHQMVSKIAKKERYSDISDKYFTDPIIHKK